MDLFRHADYAQPDGPVTVTMMFARKTTAELTAMQTAKTIGIGTLYYDTTAAAFKLGVDAGTLSVGITLAGLASAITITGGTINGTTVGATTRASVASTSLNMNSTDSSGTPGNVTNNSPIGRAAFAAAGTTVVITSSIVVATSQIFVQVMGSDATLTSARVTSVGAGTFTVTGNAAATGATTFSFLVINI